ncbi:hypothetical protein [Mycobacterium colombiense]|uniref:hypothetical protein n=1 Tax=Mycobacterium colombiense TaxID=339268 RepID=UPI0011517C07|nr:hypothetical protein [Mycobacterium colombiense]
MAEEGPPGLEDDEGRAQPDPTDVEKSLADTTDSCDRNRSGRNLAYDKLAALRRRREAAMRMEGGDPEHPGRKYHRPALGIAAFHFREGFARGGLDALQRIWAFIPTEHRAAVRAIAADYSNSDREVAL